MMNNVIIAAGAVITGLLSWMLGRKKVKSEEAQHVDKHDLERERRIDDANAKLLEGYDKMVENLKKEVERLNDVIDELRKEQEECERRNDEMESLIHDLQRRLSNLEDQSSE